MDMATTFLPLLQVFAVEMTEPTFKTLTKLMAGWVFAPRRTILGMVRLCGGDRHHAAFHRLFAAARWSVDAVGLAVFDLVTAGRDGEIFLAGDDTLLARSGRKVFGTGMHRDPILSSRSHTVTRWGHDWVVLCVVVASRWVPGRQFALPVLSRLYLNKKSAEQSGRDYRPKADLMIELLTLWSAHVTGSGKCLHFLGDSAYTAPKILKQFPRSVDVTGRVGANVRMHQPPPPTRTGQPGRPRVRGNALPKPEELLQQDDLPQATLHLYEGKTYPVRWAEQTGQFFKAAGRDVKVVAVEHLEGGRGVEVFSTTRTHTQDGKPTPAETVVTWYSWRWSVETTFQNCKGHLGIEEPQNRVRLAATRTAATGFLLSSLIVHWHETVRSTPAPTLRSWPGKRGVSFAEMLAALRVESLENIERNDFCTPVESPGVKKILTTLHTLLKLAA